MLSLATSCARSYVGTIEAEITWSVQLLVDILQYLYLKIFIYLFVLSYLKG